MNQPVPAPAQRFDVLDSFRGLFALSVVMFHLHIVGGFTEGAFFRSAGLFVEYFFTLSGFVLVHNYGQKPFDLPRLKNFMLGRFFRIFPLHWVMLLAFTGFFLTLAYLDGDFSDVLDILTGEDFLPEWLANFSLLQAWLPHADPFSFNGPAWTISVEFPVYLLFGLILVAFSRWRAQVFLLVAIGCALCVASGASFIATGGFRGITCFFLGAAIHPLCQWVRNLRWPSWLNTPLELGMLAALYACLTGSYPARSLLAACFYAVFILVYAREAGIISRVLKHPVFELLGRWSYSIYLTHFLLISLLTQAVLRLTEESETAWIRIENSAGLLYFDTGSSLGNTLLPLAFVAVVILLSRASYQYIELTGVALGKRLFRPRN